MTDKRIIKTKQILKSTLIEMMKQQPFQKIKVKDLCEQANTSKLTFYTHYDDKYALLQDVASDMELEVMEKYKELQEIPSEENGIVKHNQNMLQAILFVEDKYKQIFKTAKQDKSPTFFLYFYDFLLNAFSDSEKFLTPQVKTKYPITEFCAFLITGMWGYSFAANKRNVPEDVKREQLFQLATDLSKSNLFE